MGIVGMEIKNCKNRNINFVKFEKQKIKNEVYKIDKIEDKNRKYWSLNNIDGF